MAMNENFKIILQQSYARSNQLTNILHATRGFTVAFFVVLLTIFASTYSSKNYQSTEPIYFLIALFAILELSLWRLYDHYIDASIVDCYEKIVECEEKLHYPQKLK